MSFLKKVQAKISLDDLEDIEESVHELEMANFEKVGDILENLEESLAKIPALKDRVAKIKSAFKVVKVDVEKVCEDIKTEVLR